MVFAPRTTSRLSPLLVRLTLELAGSGLRGVGAVLPLRLPFATGWLLLLPVTSS